MKNMLSVFAGFLQSQKNAVRIFMCKVWHRRVLRRIHNYPADRKIRVVFYVSNTSKWKCQSVYDAMAASNDYEPIIALGMATDNAVRGDPKAAECEIAGMEEFFHKHGCRTVRVYDSKKDTYSDSKSLRPDIVFIQQPWGIPKTFQPWELSRIALPMYVPYYVPVSMNPEVHCLAMFFRCLRVEFVLNGQWKEAFERIMAHRFTACRYVSVGHPSLSSRHDENPSGDNNGIIYAPHFSFRHPKNQSELPYGTFEWNGRAILEYAQNHTELKWFFKPHPSLRDKLTKSGFMTPEEVDEYYSAWAKVGSVCFDGDYQLIFKKSRVMITDCSSFLVEYAVTGNPIIRLKTLGREVSGLELSERYLKTYYVASNLDEMHALFEEIITRGEDPRRDDRLAALKACGMFQNNATANIMIYVNKIFNKAGDKI